jgi:hypothetical protein
MFKLKCNLAEEVTMNSKKLLLTSLISAVLLFSFLVLVGCAVKASGPAFQRIDNVPSDKAVLYFYRPSKALGVLETDMAIVDNDSIVCNNVLMNGYCVYIANPGKHKLHSKSTVVDKITEIEIKPGDKLYFKAVHYCRAVGCFHTLNVVEENKAIEEIANYKLQK